MSAAYDEKAATAAARRGCRMPVLSRKFFNKVPPLCVPPRDVRHVPRIRCGRCVTANYSGIACELRCTVKMHLPGPVNDGQGMLKAAVTSTLTLWICREGTNVFCLIAFTWISRGRVYTCRLEARKVARPNNEILDRDRPIDDQSRGLSGAIHARRYRV